MQIFLLYVIILATCTVYGHFNWLVMEKQQGVYHYGWFETAELSEQWTMQKLHKVPHDFFQNRAELNPGLNILFQKVLSLNYI